MLTSFFAYFLVQLRRLADKLVAGSVTVGTQRNYAMVMEKLNKFCVSNRIKDKFSSSTIELFVTDLSQQQKLSHSTIQANLSAIRHYCNSNNIGITFDTPRLKLLLRGVKKVDVGAKQPRPTNRVSKNHLKRLCAAADVLFNSACARMYKAMFTIAFFGLLRPSEVAHASQSPCHQLKRKCIRFGRSILMITFFSFKHSGKPVNIKVQAISDKSICPWTNLYEYLSHSPLRAEDQLFPISTAEFAQVLRRCIEQADIKSKLTLHSFRRGGATWFSSNGMTDATLKAYGRWSSNAYLCYVKAD